MPKPCSAWTLGLTQPTPIPRNCSSGCSTPRTSRLAWCCGPSPKTRWPNACPKGPAASAGQGTALPDDGRRRQERGEEIVREQDSSKADPGLSNVKPVSWLALVVRLLTVYLFLVSFNWVVRIVSSVVLAGRSFSPAKTLSWVVFESAVEFLFVIAPLLLAIGRRFRFSSYFLGSALALTIWNTVEVVMVARSGATLVRHGLTIYDKGTITFWGGRVEHFKRCGLLILAGSWLKRR
jgi:hypothetical protein